MSIRLLPPAGFVEGESASRTARELPKPNIDVCACHVVVGQLEGVNKATIHRRARPAKDWTGKTRDFKCGVCQAYLVVVYSTTDGGLIQPFTMQRRRQAHCVPMHWNRQ